MTTTSSRTDQFKAEIAEMRLKTGRAGKEATLQLLSALLMASGVLIAFGAYQASLSVKATPGSNVDILSSNSYLVLAVTGMAVSLVGGFGFLRYSLAKFLRIWLLRQSYEQRLAIDELSATRAK